MSPWLHFFYLGTLDPILLLFYCNFAEHLQEKPKLSYISIFFQTQTFWHKYTKGKKNQSWYGRHQPPTKSKTKKQNELNKKQTHREKNQKKLYLDQVGDYIQKNIESRILIMFLSKKVNEAHDPVLAMANHASDVSWGNEMALSIEEK